MKNIALYITYAALAASTALFMGCDLDSITGSSSSGSSFDYEEIRYVNSKSEPTPNQINDGAVSVLRCGDLTIVVMEYTSLQRIRGSCSGFDNGGSPEIGDLVEVFFTDNQIDWTTGEVRPNSIKSAARECVPVWKPDFVCEPCGE